MAKKTPPSNGKSLVIVESPAKARTISKFLGRDFTVEASIGHVRDLPQGAKEIPAQYKGEDWAYLGVNVNQDFDPVYIIPHGKTAQVRKLKELLKDAKDLYLATDEDREGEAISWHLNELLKPKVPVHRLVFHEITREAIHEALEHPRQIDDALVRAQEARRIIDRLYGYEVSPLLWRKVRPKLSAGRVQSVAVRLIVQRERQRMAFRQASWWDLIGRFGTSQNERFAADLVSFDGRRIPSGKDFEPTTGQIKDSGLLHLDGPGAEDLAARLRGAEFRVASLDNKPYTSKPYPPFTTSTLQQEANRKLGFTARRTMQVAQSLYENGHITYMRTDSTNLASVAIEAARDLVRTQYGDAYLPGQPRVYVTKVKNAQEAHEAIRPAGHPFALPEQLRGQLSAEEYKLYDLVWKRTVASQMADARGHRITITVEGGGGVFQASGKTVDFPGYLRAYVEGSDDPEAGLAENEVLLPNVTVGQSLACQELMPKEHATQSPSRYSEASLTRALEELGIGRPSTYASIIDTILAREYVFKKGGALVPTWVAFAVAQLLEAHLPNLVDYRFTAQMEDDLDSISRGEAGHVDYLRKFYFGNGQTGLKQQLQNKAEEIDARDVSRIRLGQPEGEEPIFVRVGRYGPFLEQGERRASLPDETPPDEVTIERALELLGHAEQAEEPLGTCPETHKPVYLKVGRFGPYVQRGSSEDEEKPKNASLMKGMKPEDVTLAVALQLLTLPRELGPHPENGEMVVAANGRFGPYVKCGAETRSLSADLSPLDITLAQALELLAQPKAQRRGFGAKREPLRVLEASPVTGQPIQLLEGRYGPYLTDGVTNASLPKQSDPAGLTLAEALDLLAARAAAGPPAKKKFRRAGGKAAPAATPKKKTAAKKSVVKKAALAVAGVTEAAPKKAPAARKDAAKRSAKKPATKRAVAKKAATASEA
ncbi:MAG TPA: type I DNA topoisomerase [Pirellulales bacterium]|jgi:DNA topoisomerase-1|nr:type I DNA topoisomerase [Pirellulales bacterium]